jgi:hypothetical protein
MRGTRNVFESGYSEKWGYKHRLPWNVYEGSLESARLLRCLFLMAGARILVYQSEVSGNCLPLQYDHSRLEAKDCLAVMASTNNSHAPQGYDGS